MLPVFSNSILDISTNNVINSVVSVSKECRISSSNTSRISDRHSLLPSSSTSTKLKFESNILSNLTTSSIVNKQLENSNSNSVYSIEFLKKDIKSRPISSAGLLSNLENSGNSANFGIKRLNIRISHDGYLECLENVSLNWIRNCKLSADVYSHNGIFELTNDYLIYIRVCKDISAGEEIKCWFSLDILAYMAVPFLILRNIEGNNCYTCHICNTSYESPNPLKIHLALLCDQQSIDVLWIRLHHSLQKLILSSSTLSSPPFSRGLFQNPLEIQNRFDTSSDQLQMPSSLPSLSSSNLYSSQRLSAFKPITTTSSFLNSSQHILSSLPSAIASSSSSTSSPSASALANAAAQIETIVSNMGTSKQGHLCIYCGKIYSRKYGLKIHIRTHTGFKPLKCKFCFRPFGDPSNLNKHVRLHLQQSNKSLLYKCHLCSKLLGRRRDLQKHIQSRHCETLCDIDDNGDTDEIAKISSSEDD